MNYSQVTQSINVKPFKKQVQRGNQRMEAVNAPDISYLNTPDDEFDHKYNYTIAELFEKLTDYTDYNGLKLFDHCASTDLSDLAKDTSSEYHKMTYHYNKKVKRIYNKSNVTYRAVVSSSDDDDE